MNGVHDMGGMQCYGSIDVDAHAPMFYHEWEKDVLSLALAMGATGTWNLDQSRAARESLPADYYLSAGYYGIWLAALENLLVRHELVSQAELQTGTSQTQPYPVKRVLAAKDVPAALAAGAPVDKAVTHEPQFSLGTTVTVRNLHSPTHTRMPAYIRQRTGQIVRIHGAHIFPDAHALGRGEDPQWLYNVRFDNQELWGAQATPGGVHVDCWEPYLDASIPDNSSTLP